MSVDDEGSGRDKRRADRGDTQRLEAFSDGVFAVAITLLVLNLRLPAPGEVNAGGLWPWLATQWSSYLAYAISFSFILIMWINHHQLFKLIRRSDLPLLLFNGLLLLFVTLVPFSTSLLAAYIAQPNLTDQRAAAAIYSGLYTVIAICFNLLWRYGSGGRGLLDERADPRHVQGITKGFLLGPLMYFIALLLAFVSPIASLAANVALAIFWAVFPLFQRSFVRAEVPVASEVYGPSEEEIAGR
jgi:uncharacterized membrane protein